MPDLTVGERLALLPAIALMFVLGLYPQLVLVLLTVRLCNGAATEVLEKDV